MYRDAKGWANIRCVYLTITTWHVFTIKEARDTGDSIQFVYRETSSRTASAWHIFPLPPRRPLGYRTGRDHHVDRYAVKVKGSKEFLGRSATMLRLNGI